jgi:hypothetical protein
MRTGPRKRLHCFDGLGFRNITLHWLHALNDVSYLVPVLRSSVTR